MKKLTILWALLISASALQAQVSTPAPSPFSTVTQKVGLTDITIAYSRPGVKGRKVFGDLVPFGKMWRTGANMSTKLTFSDSVTINGKKIGAGDYTLATIPGEREWTIIINSDGELRGLGGYDETNDVTRFTVKSTNHPFTETFTINFSDITSKSANVQITWETTTVKFAIDADPDKQVMKNIDKALKINPVSYYQAARYYLENGKDLKQALTWINTAIEQGYERFWVLRQKSLIQAAMGDYSGAVKTAEKSLELAEKDGNDDYVKMNKKSIEEWKNMK